MYIIGAGGHTRSIIDLLVSLNNSPEGIFDDSYCKQAPEKILGIPVIGNLDDLQVKQCNNIILGIGDNLLREDLFYRFRSRLAKTLSHSRAYISSLATVSEESNLIFGNVFINAGSVLGKNNILNTGAVVEHEVEIGSHSHVSVGSVLAGRVKIGSRVFIGANAVVRDKIKICDDVIIGAGSVVVKDIGYPGVYAGVPAVRIK